MEIPAGPSSGSSRAVPSCQLPAAFRVRRDALAQERSSRSLFDEREGGEEEEKEERKEEKGKKEGR